MRRDSAAFWKEPSARPCNLLAKERPLSGGDPIVDPIVHEFMALRLVAWRAKRLEVCVYIATTPSAWNYMINLKRLFGPTNDAAMTISGVNAFALVLRHTAWQ